jgi:TolB protein
VKGAHPCARTAGSGELHSSRADGSGDYDVNRVLPFDSGPDYSPDGSLIAYGDATWLDEIHLMNADGSGDHRLFGAPCGPSYPQWSPDGTEVALESCGDVWVASTATTPTYTNLTNNYANLSPSWSPSGRWIATASSGNSPTPDALNLVKADGSGSRHLTDLPGSYRLAWNPSRPEIAVEAYGDIWFVNPITGHKTQVTNTPDVFESNPVWSPDGTWLAYASGDPVPVVTDPDNPEPPDTHPYHATDPHIWLMTATGRQQHSTGIAGVPTSWRAQN